MMNPRLYTTSYNKPQGQQFDTAVLAFIKLQYTEKSCKMINIFVLVTFHGHLPVILSAKSKGSEDMKQILIVEDDSFLNKMLAYNLTADGYGVTSALNARTAADAIRQREFDLVLLDINLPDGSEALVTVVTLDTQCNPATEYVKLRGLGEDKKYRVEVVGMQTDGENVQRINGTPNAVEPEYFTGAQLVYAGLPVPRLGNEYKSWQVYIKEV